MFHSNTELTGIFYFFNANLNRNNLTALYNLANVNYQGTIVRMARDVIMKVGGRYNAASYWKERKQIGEYMKNVLNEELQIAYTSCINLQIIRIDLPKSYEDSIVQTQVEVQKTEMRKYEQEAELIRQSIGVLISDAEKTIKIVNATGNAEAYKIYQNAQVNIFFNLGYCY